MKQLILVLAGLVAVSACSQGRGRRASETDKIAQQPDLTLPDTFSRRDTSITLSSRSSDQPVSPVEQQAPSSPRQRVKAQAASARRHRTPVAPATRKPETPTADTSIQAYAPGMSTDTTTPPDRIAEADSVRGRGSADTVVAAKSGTGTVGAPASDTLAPKPDTVASPDTVATTDTSATLPPDTSATAPEMASTATSDTGTAALAARTLPIGTEIHAALDDSITTRRDTVGQQISAHVMENVTGSDGRTLIAAGTPVRFTVTRLRASRSKNSQGRLAIRADSIAFNGQLLPVKAEVQSVPRELRGRGVTGSEAAKVGGGAAAGAVLGRVVGGNTRGAVIGGVAGAAAGAVVANQTATRDIVVKAKTPVVLVLTASLVTPVTR
jgi:hypothetical protein